MHHYSEGEEKEVGIMSEYMLKHSSTQDKRKEREREEQQGKLGLILPINKTLG